MPNDRFNFLITDSLNNLKIDVSEVQKIRETYKGAALIAITQSTKEGKMRGSNEIIHACDVEISIVEGIASTTKNRFNATNVEFEIFKNSNSKQKLNLPRNIVE